MQCTKQSKTSRNKIGASRTEEKDGSCIPTKAMTTLDTSSLDKLILNNQKLTKKMKSLIDKGVSLIENDAYSEAISYIQSAENILEYAANSGKSIDQILITATLQNKACIYQRLWETEKSYNYIEAILHNLSDTDNKVNSNFSPRVQQQSAVFLHRKQALGLYYLKYSAVASQINNHEIGLASALKSIKIIQQVCKISHQCLRKSKHIGQIQNSLNVLSEIAQFQESAQISQISQYQKRTKTALLQMKKNSQPRISKQIIKQLQSFTIGEVMQIFPVTIQELMTVPSFEEQISDIGVVFKALYFSIGFFAVATQLRLKNSNKYLKTDKSEQFIKSQIYHLNAIYLGCRLAPCPTQYLHHLIKSYSNHYESNMKERETYRIGTDFNYLNSYTDAIPKDAEEKIESRDCNIEKQVQLNQKQKKSLEKKANSLVEVHLLKKKKSLSKQKSTGALNPTRYKPNFKEQVQILHRQAIQDHDKLQPHHKKHKKNRLKIESLKNLKPTGFTNSNNSKSKQKNPNLQTVKKKSLGKKQKNIKLQQEYYLEPNRINKKKTKNNSKIQHGEYTNQYLRSSSTSEFPKIKK